MTFTPLYIIERGYVYIDFFFACARHSSALLNFTPPYIATCSGTWTETTSDLELSDSNRSRSSSSSKSRASIRYLENIQKTINTEEKSDTQSPKKREKRVSIAAQRYLAATSISSMDDKEIIEEETNTEENDVEVKDEPKINSDVQQTEQEVVEGA